MSTPDKLSEERHVEGAVCTDLPTAGPEVCRAQVLWNSRVRSHDFNELGPRCHDFPLLLHMEHTPLAIDKLLSHSCGRDQTGGAATPREEILHNHQVPELIAIAPLPTESATNSHSVSAQTNGRNYQLVGHDKVAGLGAALLVNSPERRANCAWDRNPSVHNHIICFCKSSADGAVRAAYSPAEGLQTRRLGLPQSAQPQRQPTLNPRHSTTPRTHVHGSHS